MKPIDASKKSSETEVYANLQDRRVKQQPENELGQLVRTADIKRAFRKGDSTNYSYKLYTLLLPTKLSLEHNDQIMKKLKLIP